MNEELVRELELLRIYKEKGCLDTHYKVLIDYIDELEKNNQLSIHKLELLIEDLKKNQEVEKESGKSYFNTDLFAIRVIEILKILKGEMNE